MKPNIISESPRPIWQIPIAALFFTITTLLILLALYQIEFTEKGLIIFLHRIKPCIFFVSIGIGFTLTKSIHIDIENSKFRPTYNIGPLKIGSWQTIKNYEYVSVFHQPIIGGDYIFEVNLWYDNNKHFELYEEDNYKEAFLIGYELSEQLNIDLLDATEPNNFKWVDKDKWKTKMAKGSIE
ncbi:hypothetical protein [uncultured Winogradskyella sp.]|uniref:hypothetical protein n=1 Tax=uncultured Winogradskyella sp. TaxID=395353 RepID=UPI002622E3E3|nr:hypothetical protein [uncultured Winogradskyella sp.]|tara:strand:- start:121 stop:666 length:546 start_codon:yes stop_codon:yes gene_type:complete